MKQIKATENCEWIDYPHEINAFENKHLFVRKKPTKKDFREYLNNLPNQHFKNGRYSNYKRPYGDYLYSQDREKFNLGYNEFCKN